MQLRTRVIGAAGIAAVVAAGGSAFTASNTGVPAAKNLGFSSTSVTGAEVSGMAFTVNATDKTHTDAITYPLATVADDLAPDAVAHVYVGTTGNLVSYGCVITAHAVAVVGNITCDTITGAQLHTADIEIVQLVVQ